MEHEEAQLIHAHNCIKNGALDTFQPPPYEELLREVAFGFLKIEATDHSSNATLQASDPPTRQLLDHRALVSSYDFDKYGIRTEHPTHGTV